MSLKPGKSKKIVSRNISEMVEAGYSQKQAVAAALDKAREKRKSRARRTLGKKKMKHPELRGRVEP